MVVTRLVTQMSTSATKSWNCVRLLEWIGQSPLDFSSYEKNIDGTWKLKSDLYDLYKEYANEATVARYILGCCIYHQLLYNQSLEADYEG